MIVKIARPWQKEVNMIKCVVAKDLSTSLPQPTSFKDYRHKESKIEHKDRQFHFFHSFLKQSPHVQFTFS